MMAERNCRGGGAKSAGAAEFMVTMDGFSVARSLPALIRFPDWRPGPADVGALAAGLGTGGYALVVAIPDRLRPMTPIARTS